MADYFAPRFANPLCCLPGQPRRNIISAATYRLICCAQHISRFCDLLRGFERPLSPVMRQHHVAREKAFVYYSGKRIAIVDPHPASVQDRDGAVPLLQESRGLYPFIERVFADTAYAGERAANATRVVVEIVRKLPDQVGFVVLPKRCVVERFFAWINRNRRLAKDFEGAVASATAFLYAASAMLLMRRLARAELFYTISPQGDNTLTVRNGRRALLKALLKADRLDRVKGDEEVKALIDDRLVSPVLRRVLCNPTNFSFNPNSVILAKVSRTELGDFNALVLGLLLMSHAKGQVVVSDFGFYGRDIHSRLIREERLIAGVNFLSELPEKLRRTVLLINEKIPSGTTVEDAEELARYERLAKGANGFLDFVAKAIA